MLLHRRSVVLGTLAAAAFPEFGKAQAGSQPFVRHDVASPQGKAMLRIYAQGVQALKDQNRVVPLPSRSWMFQWYTHQIPNPNDPSSGDPGDTAGTVQSLYGSARDPNAMLALEMWNTCQSHQGQPEDYFLPWHRMYVLFLESIIRTVTNTPSFTLPYWNYTDPRYYAIPPEFRNPSDPVFGVLYQQNRNTDDGMQFANVNAGQNINRYFPGRRNPLNLNAMNEPDYSGDNGFNAQLDFGVHGSVHVLTGNQTNMGNVPTAAEDPVFWVHHCNIDRIWYGWNAAGGRNPSDPSWTGMKFVFADGSGARVEVPIGRIDESAKLNYTYDALPVPPNSRQRVAQASTTLLQSAPAPVAAAAMAPIGLGATPQRVTMFPNGPQNSMRTLAAAAAAGTGGRIVLTLNNIQVRNNPNTVYSVYMDLPPNASPEVEEQHFVGLLNFFGIMPAGAHAAHGAPGGQAGRSVNYDITDLVARLGGQNRLQGETVVTLVPQGAPAANSEPVITGGIVVRRP